MRTYMSHYALKIENYELKIIETIPFFSRVSYCPFRHLLTYIWATKKRKNWVRDKKAKSRKSKKQQGTKGTL